MGSAGLIARYDGYNPAADIVVVAICIVIINLIFMSYINRTRNFQLFVSMILLVLISATIDIVSQTSMIFVGTVPNHLIYVTRFIYHALLFAILILYIWYIVEIMHINGKVRDRSYIFAISGYVVFLAYDIAASVLKFGFYIEHDSINSSGLPVFVIGYIYLVSISVYLMIRYRKALYRNVMLGFFGTVAVSFIVLLIQGFFRQSSFTVSTFLLPVIAMFYLVHSNPYDLEMGAVDSKGFEDLLYYNYTKKTETLLMSLYLPEYDHANGVMPNEIQTLVRSFSSQFFKGAILFKINNGQVVLVIDLKKNPDYENRMNQILNSFNEEYKNYRIDYKIVAGKSISVISKNREYISFYKYIHQNMNMNEVRFMSPDDITGFNTNKNISEQLLDIFKRKDLEDPRVEVYCQPVYNLATDKYDTAEALMRLRLPGVGMVFPDTFIPMAEENHYIHVLTLIILNKTCQQIRKLIVAGYEVNRISINVSASELRDDNFCDDINNVIKESGIPDNRIAIEITESQSESDFLLVKEKIDELKDHGIKFYLDDFGTGYSNIERIMELPFDIIKFDRSLVVACEENEKSMMMVGSLAKMFSSLNYSVLYEGVENDIDEQNCKDMSASYLQGYKYSRPIPIDELTHFFTKS